MTRAAIDMLEFFVCNNVRGNSGYLLILKPRKSKLWTTSLFGPVKLKLTITYSEQQLPAVALVRYASSIYRRRVLVKNVCAKNSLSEQKMNWQTLKPSSPRDDMLDKSW